MIKLAADENFNGRILRGLKRRLPSLDVIRIQDIELLGAEDPVVLEWCAVEDRVLMTLDVATLVGYDYERVDSGRPMPGVLEISVDLAIGRAIEELMLVIQAARPEDCADPVFYLPL